MSTDPGSTSLPPDEAAFHAAWLGKLWPHYRPLFEGGHGGRRFEWRAALYPLWMGIPGLWRPLNAVVVIALALSIALFVTEPGFSPLIAVLAAAVALACWPGVIALLLYAIAQGEPPIPLALWPALMIAVSATLGLRAPRWIVAEGRRRWSVHGARAATGDQPALPRAITARLLFVIVAVVLTAAAVLIVVADRMERAGHQEMARVAQMKSDLRSLVTAQEAYFLDHTRYTADMSALDYYEVTSGVTLEIQAATDSGWSAVARHNATAMTCAVFVGTAAPPVAGANEGEPRCVGQPR